MKDFPYDEAAHEFQLEGRRAKEDGTDRMRQLENAMREIASLLDPETITSANVKNRVAKCWAIATLQLALSTATQTK